MRSILVMVGFGVLLLFALTVAGQSERMKSDRKTQTKVQQKEQATKSTRRTVTASSQPASEAPITATTSPATANRADATVLDIPWLTINGGGQPMSSANWGMKPSVGQSTVGYSIAASNETGIGYWYGVLVKCPFCPHQNDFDEDGFITAADLAQQIDILFAGQPDVKDPNCPVPRADDDCDGFTTATDLAIKIDYLFAGGPSPCNPCLDLSTVEIRGQ